MDGKRIVGAVRTKPQEKDLYIHTIAVDPARQGTGVEAKDVMPSPPRV